MAKTAYHLIIEGKVQGVSYRNWTYDNAKGLNVKGWVRNLEDGTVEAHFEGKKEEVEKLIELCYEGPILANVSRIEQKKVELENFDNFRVLY